MPASQPLLSPLTAQPSYMRVAQAIEHEILSGRLKAGDLLPIEGDLAEQLGVHRSTLREGIRALENAGLVRRGGAKRLVVSIPDSSTVAWNNARLLGLNKVSFRALWEIQTQLEPMAARAAAERRTRVQAESLQALVLRTEAEIEDDSAVIRNDIAFHQLIAEAAQNPVLSLITAPLGIVLYSATVRLYAAVPPARHRLFTAHRQIADAIDANDGDQAEVWMVRHIADFRRGYEVGGLDLDAPIPLEPRAFDAAPGARITSSPNR